MADPVKRKKGPGRPKKELPGPPLPLEGILTAPQDPADVMELAYFDPQLFKTIFTYYKRAEVGEVHIEFTPEMVIITSWDHNKHSKSKTEIYGKEMNLYYCEEPISICVGHKNVNNALKNVNKSYARITLSLRRQDCRSKLYIVLEDRENNVSEVFGIPTVNPEMPPEIVDMSASYPLVFRMGAKRLRETVKNAKSIGGSITIEKTTGMPLQITTRSENNSGMDKVCVFADANTLIRNTLENGDILAVSLKIDVIKPFTDTGVCGEMVFSVDKINDLKIESIIAYTVYKEDGKEIRREPACRMNMFFILDIN